MSPAARRRFLLASLVAIAGCATPLHGYLWKYEPSMNTCQEVTWHQVAPNRIPGLCNSNERAASYGTSCALGCVVVSQYSEAQAHHIDLWGESLYAHESRHVLEKKVHPHE